ncbi:hypothetical protein [Jiangella mangrovi]|uniref:GH15 family glucan-1,4-alpha-glucosidase n=1 Tax=Jiangella mangrovi TaxID=1524084 RepID=A0A7W9GQ37_9ACTN|nr:hypothetical protein [Jiangella mangrovi]MBB5787967.1 GH15 family glucan-1,4-alpha-glucosidase [Jiangella mangrovi]
MRSSRRLAWRIGLPAVILVIAALSMAPTRGTVLQLRADGVMVEPDGGVATVPADSGAAFIPGTSVLSSANRADPATAARIDADRDWLADGVIPGHGTRYHAMSERALLDLRALTSPTGALMAAPVTAWKHVWPRDASFAAAAYAVTGHDREAADVLGFLARVAPWDGEWEARYLADGSGPPDDRPKQLDSAGWVLWAVWLVSREVEPDVAAEILEELRPAVIVSANALVRSLDDDGLPEPSSDYWEKDESDLTLGVAAPVSLGLRAALALAPLMGVEDPFVWDNAARRLDDAIEREFGRHGYPRTLPDGGADAAVTFLAPPFAPATPQVTDAVRATEIALRVPNGGHRPGEAWRKDVDVAWTPETALLALAMAGNGDSADADRLLTFLDTYRTPLGSLPEKVDAEATPASVAPLAWTSSLVLLTLAELERGLPVVPAAP